MARDRVRCGRGGEVAQAGHAGFARIARELRATDVHPPLYFWTAAAWRRLAGGSLFVTRLASVLFSLGALAVLAAIARLARIPAATAMLLTLGCYAFAYTGAIARGFALAQLLTLSGVALALLAAQGRRRAALPAGVLLGAATFANYLAVFVGLAALLWLALRRSGRVCSNSRFGTATWQTEPLPSWPGLTRPSTPSRWRSFPRFALHGSCVDGRFKPGHDGEATQNKNCRPTWLLACLGFVLWMPADLWFFLAQRQSRDGQFLPFRLLQGLARLGQFLAASLFGGLPLYVQGTARVAVTLALLALLAALLGILLRQWRRIGTPETRLLFALAAAAPPIGLIVLGIAFDTTPIELRYLAFATPFAGLLLAGGFAALPRRWGMAAWGLVLAVQAAAMAGMLTRPETMQPARATAVEAAALAGDGVVLLPRGNDGVGIVSAFANEAPPALHLLVVDKDEFACAHPCPRRRLSARGAGAARPGRRQPRDASRDAPGLRRSLLAPGRRRIQDPRLRTDLPARYRPAFDQGGVGLTDRLRSRWPR